MLANLGQWKIIFASGLNRSLYPSLHHAMQKFSVKSRENVCREQIWLFKWGAATENCDFWFQKRRRSRKSYWLKVFANRNVFHRKIIIFQHFLFVIFGLRWFHCRTLFLITLAQILTEQIWHDGKIGGWQAGKVDWRRKDEAKRKHEWIPFRIVVLGTTDRNMMTPVKVSFHGSWFSPSTARMEGAGGEQNVYLNV